MKNIDGREPDTLEKLQLKSRRAWGIFLINIIEDFDTIILAAFGYEVIAVAFPHLVMWTPKCPRGGHSHGRLMGNVSGYWAASSMRRLPSSVSAR